MPLYGCQPPTGYGMTAADWMNTGALINRMNFVTSMIDDGAAAQARAARQARAAGTRADPAGNGGGRRAAGPIRVDLAALASDTSEASRNAVVDALLGGEASSTTRQALARASSPAQMVALTLGSPEFQRR
jgi:uncharacterized protein (DUF1800 family)